MKWFDFLLSDNYEKALSRLKCLEEESNVSTAASDSESLGKRKSKKTARMQEFNTNQISSDDEAIPDIPILKPFKKLRVNVESVQSVAAKLQVEPVTPQVSSVNLYKRIGRTESSQEPVYTFNELSQTIKRVEGEFHCKFQVKFFQ